jgi:hypothetical protein
MPRRHLFVIVVLLGAVAVAGLLAVTRTVALGSAAQAPPSQDAAISFRLQRLDRLEASLRKQLAAQGAATSPAPITLYRRSTAQVPGSSESFEEHELDESDDSGWEDDRDD